MSNSIKNTIENKYQIIKWSYLSLVFIFFLILSFLSMPISDASLYFHETVHIAETLKNGDWIGIEPVGTHGFIFKMIPAGLFILFGVEPIILPIFHILLAFVSILIFERILKHYISEKIFLISGILIFSSTYFFISGALTYLREMPVLFSTLIFYYFLIKNKRNWLIGLSLLLVFDAKEHVFFQLAPGLFLYSFYYQVILKKQIKNFIIDNIFYWLPVFIYLLAMLYTCIIPINSFVLAILPLSQKGTSWLVNGFVNGYITSNIKDLYEVPLYLSPFWEKLYYIRFLLSKTYIAKPFLPRVFSFLSVHFIFVVPAIYYTFSSMVKKGITKKNSDIDGKLSLYFIFISYLTVYFFRVSHGRYLLSLSPLIILFFLQYISELKGKSKKMFFILIIFTIITLSFELNYILVKFFIALIMLFLLYKVMFFRKENILLLAIVAMIFTIGTTLVALTTLDDGFIKRYIYYGPYEGVDNVFSSIELENGCIYTNLSNVANARSFLKSKIPNYFSSDRFELLDIFHRKKNMLNTYYDFPNVYTSSINNQELFLNGIRSMKIEQMVIFISLSENKKYPNENFFKEIVKDRKELFILENTIIMKDNNVYIYKIVTDKL